MASAAQNVMLAQKWEDGVDPTGWWMSEKLDGVRAYWSGSKFYSRQGNEFMAPKWFTKDLPREPLDGELWCGRGLFQKTLSIIKKTKDWEKHADDWKYVTYLVFDAPGQSAAGRKYEERVKWLEDNIEPKKETTYAAVVGVCKCTGRDHLQKMLKQVLMKGGEGIMLRKPKSLYENCRSHTLLKVKFFHDEECKVTGHENGSGRLQHLMGKIHCVLPNGVTFKIGTGFSDAQRRSPPKIGSVVTFKFQEMSDHGHPRFPVFLRERKDMTWADVLQNAKTKPPFSSLKKKAIPLLQKQHSILFSTIPSRDADSGKKVVTSDDADDDVDDSDVAPNLLTTSHSAAGAAASSSSSKKRAALKPMCKWGDKCYQKNKAHLDKYDHPGIVGDIDDEDDDADEDDNPKKRARTASVTSPSAPASSSSPPAPAPAPAAAAAVAAASSSTDAAAAPAPKPKKECMWGHDCYRKDPDHLKMYTHPAPVAAPRTKEEFIETTNQSQHDLAEYYQFGGDAEEEEVEAFLADDKNERRLSIQKFNENNDNREEVPMEDEDGEPEDRPTDDSIAHEDVRTVVVATKKASFFEACASDDEDESTNKTILVADLAKRQRTRSKSNLIRVSSTDQTVVIQKATAAAAAAAPASASATTAKISPAPLTNNSSRATSVGSKCPFILPELLAKDALTVTDEEGNMLCKKCKQEVGDHRESR